MGTQLEYSCNDDFILTETIHRCSAHLINEGVVIANGVVSIMVQVTGPSSVNRLDAQFECKVDRSGSFSPCKLNGHIVHKTIT